MLLVLAPCGLPTRFQLSRHLDVNAGIMKNLPGAAAVLCKPVSKRSMLFATATLSEPWREFLHYIGPGWNARSNPILSLPVMSKGFNDVCMYVAE